MNKKQNNVAYIDAANLYKGVGGLGWQLDYRRFRIWLRDKFGVSQAYLFIGLVPGNKNLYTSLQEAGFTLVFKEVSYDGNGKVKGNCDATLVLKATSDHYEKKYGEVILVSSDGDYAELVQFFKEKGVLRMVIAPSNRCSYLLRKQNIPLLYLDTQRSRLEIVQKEKAPDADKTA